MSVDSSFFLFIANTWSESVNEKITATGSRYMRKSLNSGPDNWKTISSLAAGNDCSGVLVKLNAIIIRRIVEGQFFPGEDLLSSIGSTGHIVFAHESLLGIAPEKGTARDSDSNSDDESFFDEDEDEDEDEDREWPSYHFPTLSDETREKFREAVLRHRLNLVPYRTNAELNVLSNAFVDNKNDRLLLRVYVPKDRLWAEEAEKFTDLLHDWLWRVKKYTVKKRSYSTAQGDVFEFHGEDSLTGGAFSTEMREFSDFLELCMNDATRAEQLMVSLGHLGDAGSRLVERYTKQARRLSLDLRHSRDAKMLAIFHALESEALELDLDPQQAAALARYDTPSPPATPAGVLATPTTPPIVVNNPQNVNFVHDSQFIGRAEGIIAREISGTANYGQDAQELLSLIQSHGEDDKTSLEAAVHELEDEETSSVNKLAAKKKIQAFLFTAAQRIGDVAIQAGQKYLESKFGL